MGIDQTINFLRFLTLRIPMSVEDLFANGLMQPLSFQQVGRYIRIFRQTPVQFCDRNKFNIYVHVPYCAPLCTYCHCSRSLLKEPRELREYVDVLIGQIKLFAPLFREAEAQMLCFGGGTPSLFECRDMDRLFNALEKNFVFSDRMRIQFEGTPASLTEEKMQLLKDRSVERLSIGVQSLDPVVLRAINRKQTTVEVLQCLSVAKKLGFPFVNVDLVAGLPQQSVKGFVSDLTTVIREGADIVHVNPFSDPGGRGNVRKSLVTLKEQVHVRNAMMAQARKVLEKSGYSRTGSEAYSCKKGGEDYQELSYMERTAAVLGLGTFAQSQLPGQLVFSSLPATEVNKTLALSGCVISPRYAMAQYVALHMAQGLRASTFRKVFGQDLKTVFSAELEDLVRRNIIRVDKGVYRYAGPWSMSGLFHYFSSVKLLFGQDFLQGARERFASEYDPREDYGGTTHIGRVYQNSWIATIYYQMGI